MTVETNLYKSFTAFGGLDLRVSDLLREKDMATEALNIEYRDSGALNKRKGFQVLTRSNAGIGMTTYHNKDINTLNISEEVIGVDNRLAKIVEDSFTITYSGSGTAYYNLFLNDADSNFYFEIEEDGVNVLSVNLGTGKESSYATVADLVTVIDALADFACTSPTIDTEPSAFIPVARNVVIASTGTSVTFKRWEDITIPESGTNLFYDAYYNQINNEDFEGASFVSMNDVLYISTGYDLLVKYDGNRAYRAGLKTPTVPINNGLTGGGSLTGVYKWRVTYEYTDAKGNILESVAGPTLTATLSSTTHIALDIPQLVSGYLYNTDRGYSTAGLGVPDVTIPVDSGHSLKKGDTACFVNALTGALETRLITATTATSISIDGASVTLAAGSYITAGLRVNLWRTKAGGDTFYLCKQFVNDKGNTYTAFNDGTADSALGAEFVDPLVNYLEFIPNCKYMTTWRGHVIAAGDRNNIDTMYWSEVNSPEQWSNDFSLIVDDFTGTRISGLGSLDNVLFAFKEESAHSITGELATNNIQVDRIPTQGIGCLAHKTIIEVDGNLMFLSKNGPYMIAQNGETVFIGEKISPRFKNSSFNFNQAKAYNWVKKDKILLQMPVVEASTSGNDYVGTSSKVFVFDTYRKAWLEWTNVDFNGGITDSDDLLWCTRWELDSLSGTSKYYAVRFLENGDEFDYADHTEPIPAQYATNWENAGEPTVFKKYTRLKVHSLEGGADSFESNQFQINVETEHDYNPIVLSSFELDFSGGASGWGNSPWGNFPWGEVRLTALKHKLIQRKSKSIRLRFKNETLLQNFLISGFEVELLAPYKPRIKE